jgi:rod shape determining protein RodA
MKAKPNPWERKMIKTPQRLFHAFDWLWFFALLALSSAGILAIWSTTADTGLHSYFGKQIIYFGCALISFFIFLSFDYHFFSDYISILYVAGISVLGLVLVIGSSIHNNKSWIKLGIISVQPSEIVKILVIIALAKYYSELDIDYLGFRELLIGAFIALGPALLVALQRDIGTMITFFPIYGVLSCLAGIRRKHLILLLLIVIAAVPITWFLLQGYHKSRIETVFNPSTDPRHYGYQTIQSEIAIGSGRFLGKGFKQGSQGHLGFLPARHTDFVFSVLAEEKGFLGSISILSLFLFIAFRLFRTVCEAKDKVGAMIVSGVLALFLFHVFINIGMVVGLMPIIGVPLPFISAGGSSLISCFIAMGLCMGIRIRRYVN